jgi:uncharacterized protein (DUF2062 family)
MGKKFKEIVKDLVRLHNSPPEIAFGVAIGVFIAVMPFYGFHTIMVIIAAILVRRANKIAILAGTNVSIPPTLPFITWTGYDIGRLILGKRYPPLDLSFFSKLTFQKFMDFYLPLLLGSMILGIVLGAIFYFLTLAVVKIIKKRRQQANPAEGRQK